MTVTWADVVGRIKVGDVLQPLVGNSKLLVESVDEQQVCIRQRLWRACVTRADLETGAKILDAAPGDVTPVELSELIRAHYTAGPEVTTDCTRIPNVVAIVLFNLGVVPGAQPAV